MPLEFIESLSEARMFKTRDQISREGARTLTDHLFVSLLSLFAMSNDYNYAPVAAEYARRTGSRGNYNSPNPSGTDLYQTIYSLKRPGEMFGSDKDGMLMNKVNLEDQHIKRFVDKLKTGNVSSAEAGQFFFRLERNLKIEDPKLRAARRLVQDWEKLSTTQRQLASTQIMKYFRISGKRSDLMPLFAKFTGDNNLEMSDTKKHKVAKTVARKAAAFGIGYAAGKATEL